MLSLTCTRNLRVALSFSVALNVMIGPVGVCSALAANDGPVSSKAGEITQQIDDLNTRMRNILNTPVDFCDPVAVDANQRAYGQLYIQKFELQRQTEKSHPTLAQGVQKAVNDAADEGDLRDDSPIVEDYEAAMRRDDTAAANALMPKMNPWEEEQAAEWSHNNALVFQILTPMANQGNVKAETRLAFLYSWQTNFNMATIHVTVPLPPRDDALAFKYARLAALAGDEASQEMLAKAYACGFGTEKNLVKAYAWFNLALSQSALMLNTNEKPEVILRRRDFIAAQMSRDDVQGAKKLMIQCNKSGYKNCD